MPRPHLFRNSEFPYHLTARSNNREPFPIPLDQVWDLFVFDLEHARVKFGIQIHAFVLMPNHFHLVVTTPLQDLGVVSQWFMSSITRSINKRARRSGRVFGGKYFRTLINSEDYLDIVLKYVYRNPIRAGLSKRPEDYPWSTYPYLKNPSQSPLQLTPAVGHAFLIPNNDLRSYADWVEAPFGTERTHQVRESLRRAKITP